MLSQKINKFRSIIGANPNVQGSIHYFAIYGTEPEQLVDAKSKLAIEVTQ